ncbi:MAG: pre-peptidase C-terminal domain-containing protein, partial [Verrucomicrobiota bacterium]
AGSTIQIRFTFDTIDAFANGFEGWYIDDIVVETAGLADGPSDYYAFSLNAGETVGLVAEALTPGALKLDLYDGTSTLLASGLGRDNVSQTISGFIAPAADTYYARVRGLDNDYNLVVTRESGFDEEPNNAFSSAQTLNTSGRSLGHVTPTDTDWYRFNVNAGDTVTVHTVTPSDDGFEIGNTLDPLIELFDTNNVMVAMDDNSGPDSRNAMLVHTTAMAGAYRLHVAPAAGTDGEVLVTVSGASGVPSGFAVEAVIPTNNALLGAYPAIMTVIFSEAVSLGTLDASDLMVGGMAASSFSARDGRTVDFTLPPQGEGTHAVTMASGSVFSVQGGPLEAYSGQFTVDLSGPRLASSSIMENDLISGDSIAFTAVFTEALNAAVLDAGDFILMGANTGTFTPDSFNYAPGTMTLVINYSGLPEDDYSLTLFANQIADTVGNQLDGEPIGFPTGNGVPGGNFVVNFSIDSIVAPFYGNFGPVDPPGSLIYTGLFAAALQPAGDTDTFTLPLDTNQTLTVDVSPDPGVL